MSITFRLLFCAAVMAIIPTLVTSREKGQMVGGLTGEKTPKEDDEVTTIVKTLSKEIKTEVASKLSGSNDNLDAAQISVISYKTQVVAGTNFFVKSKVGDHIFHLRIFRNLSGVSSLSSVKGPQKDSDQIEYFY